MLQELKMGIALEDIFKHQLLFIFFFYTQIFKEKNWDLFDKINFELCPCAKNEKNSYHRIVESLKKFVLEFKDIISDPKYMLTEQQIKELMNIDLDLEDLENLDDSDDLNFHTQHTYFIYNRLNEYLYPYMENMPDHVKNDFFSAVENHLKKNVLFNGREYETILQIQEYIYEQMANQNKTLEEIKAENEYYVVFGADHHFARCWNNILREKNQFIYFKRIEYELIKNIIRRDTLFKENDDDRVKIQNLQKNIRKSFFETYQYHPKHDFK